MRPRMGTFAILILLLCLPSGTALVIEDAPMSARIVAAFGQSTAMGDLGVFALPNVDGGGHVPDASFRLEAGAVRLETDHSNLTILAAGVTEYGHDPQTSVQEHGHSFINSTENRPGSQLYVFPMGRTVVEAWSPTCSDFYASAIDDFQQSPLVSTKRDPNHADTSSAIKWSACMEGTVTLTGDFLLRLWEWDATLEGGGGRQTLHSGRDVVQPVDSPTAYETTEHFIFAQGARLSIQIEDVPGTLYLTDASISHAITLRLMHASIALDGEVVDGRDIQVHGDFQATLEKRGTRVEGSLGGTLTRATVDKDAWATAELQQGPSPSQASLAGLATAGALLVTVGAYLWLRPWLAYGFLLLDRSIVVHAWPETWGEKRGAGYWYMALGALKRSHGKLGGWYASRAGRWFPDSPDPLLALADANHIMGRLEEARAGFIAAHAILAPGMARALAACGAARVAAAMEDEEQVREWLEAAQGEDELAARIASHDLEFSAFEDKPWLTALRTSRPPERKLGDVAFA